MKLPQSPCLACSHTAICGDSWYGCKEWNAYFRAKWPDVTTACKRVVHFLHLYQDGKNDREIAQAVGVPVLSVFNWRKRNQLPPVGKRGRPPAKRLPAEAGGK